ncbi:MAG: FecR domain-containing protein [Puia sp.]|nr:FecR domain-containing protein [Puia sp.]
MTFHSIRLEDLFDKYVRGTITAEEFNEFWRLVQEGQADGTLSAKLTRLWQEWADKTPQDAGPDKSKVFSRIMEKGKEREIDFEKFRPVPLIRRWRVAAAAAAVLVIAIGLYLLFTGHPDRAGHTATQYAVQTITHPDYIRNIVLPDGSTVVLHAGSTLDYPAGFPDSSREVSLQGEAYFDVRHDNKRPFIIHTGKVRTIVLGTAFNISSDSNRVTVSVTGGKVRVENGRKVLAELAPNQQIVYNVPQDEAEQRTVNAERLVTNWTKKDMVFDGDDFGSIAETISQRYGVAIRFRNPELARCLIVASFSGTETLENVLETLCTIRNASYTRSQDDKAVEIDGKGCE